MSDQNSNGQAGSASAEGNPELEEVQIGDRKVLVSKGSKDLLMTQSDYTKKTQALAEERRKLEEQIVANQQNIQVANNLMAVLSEDEETANILEAAIAKDKEKLKKLVMKAADGGGEDSIGDLKKKIEALEGKINAQAMQISSSEKRKIQIEDARKRAKDMGIDLDKYSEKITKAGSDNIMLSLAIAAANEDLTKQAEEKGRALGRKEALEELTKRLDNTPPISGGSGEKQKAKYKDLRSATSAAYQEILSKQLGGS